MSTGCITKVYLLNTPLENDYKHTLYFENKSTQQSYFQSKIVKSYTDFSYQRKDFIIRVPDNYDNLYNCNYVMYQNTNYSNKWFYAFINEIKYVNDGTSELHIETDVIQTWMFDYEVKPSFIEREHIYDDTYNANSVPESLETGDYMVHAKVNSNISEACVVIATTYDIYNNKPASGSFVNGVFHGVDYYVINTDIDTIGIKTFLSDYMNSKDVGAEAITSLFMVPKQLVNYDNIDWDLIPNVDSAKYKKLTGNTMKATNLGDVVLGSPIESNGSYKPRNKKLLMYPYQYLLCSNNNGSSAIYKYEHFTHEGKMFSFGIEGALTPGCSIKTYPKYYKVLKRIMMNQ